MHADARSFCHAISITYKQDLPPFGAAPGIECPNPNAPGGYRPFGARFSWIEIPVQRQTEQIVFLVAINPAAHGNLALLRRMQSLPSLSLLRAICLNWVAAPTGLVLVESLVPLCLARPNTTRFGTLFVVVELLVLWCWLDSGR